MSPQRRDKFSKAKRSEIMSRIRSKNTRLDIAMKRILQKAGITFRMYPKMVGNPDFLVEDRITLFCDSSFWHGRNWKKLRAQLEKGSNASYWVTHIAKNRSRDRQVNANLRRRGYRVLRFWDFEVFSKPEQCSKTIKTATELCHGKRNQSGKDMSHPPYVMTISRTTVDKLGIKLYDKASAVVAELIANSYDADAEHVKVEVPLNRWLSTKSKGGHITDQGLEISVEDDGLGMEPEVINDFYLRVGTNPRDDPERGPFSPDKKRARMGRKGIGKLAPFGICKIIEVRSAGGKKTSQGYKTAHLILNYDEINADTDEDYEPKTGPEDGTFSLESGTTIKLKDFLYRRTPDEETFHRQLAKIFGRPLPDFEIEVTNTENKTKFKVGQLKIEIQEETKISVDDRPVVMADGSKLLVQGYVAYTSAPYRNEEAAGVRIYARGKLVASTRDFGLRAGFTGEHTLRSYLTGEIHADWLDEEEDLIHTGRQDILWDSERGETFKNWGQLLLRELGKKSWTPMRQKAYRVFLEKSDLESEVKKRFPNDPEVAQAAMELGKAIGQIASLEQLEDPEYVQGLKEIVLTTAPHKMWVDTLKQVTELPVDSSLDQVVALLGNARLAETSSMGQIALERVDVIRTLEGVLGKNPSTKEDVLQGLLEQAPWTMHPEWTVLQANKPFENLRSAFERWYKKKYNVEITTKVVPNKKEPDFVMLPFSGSIEIVEIKRSGHKLTNDEFARIVGYYDAMEGFLKDNPEFRKEFPRTHVWLICDAMSLSRPNELALKGLMDDDALTRTTWEELLGRTKRANQAFLDQRHEISD